MITDRTSDLVALVELARTSSKESRDSMAISSIEDIVEKASLRVQRYAIGASPWLERMNSFHRDAVRTAARALRDSVGHLAHASDGELLAYSSGSPEGRGALGAIDRNSVVLSQALLAAQRAFFEDLAETLWPEVDLARLDVLAHLPDSSSAARGVQAVRERIVDRGQQDAGASTLDLELFDEDATAAAARLRMVETGQVPDEVVAFWRIAAQPDGAALHLLTPGVASWLAEHDAQESFRVRRIQ